MKRQSNSVTPTSSFDDVIARLKLLHCTDTTHKSLFDVRTTICLQNLESLRKSANVRIGLLLAINSSENIHWIVRAIVNAIYSEHERLSIEIERLLALLDDRTRIKLHHDLTVQKNAFVQINQLNDLAMSTLRLEQQVETVLLEICQNESVLTHTNFCPTLH